MALVDVNSLKINDTIKFKSISDHDVVLWEGTITAFCNHEDARLREDILPYYREVKKYQPALPSIEMLTFFVLRVMENGTTQKYRLFALEYIDPSTLTVNDVYAALTFQIYGMPAEEAETILTLLRAHRYSVQQIL